MSVAGVAFAVLLILIIVSLYRGWSGASALFSELPGDLWVAQTGTTDPFRAASFLPADRLDELERIEGVRAVLPVYARRVGVDSVLAREAGLGVGDALTVLDQPLVIERVSPGGNPVFELGFVNGTDAEELLRLDDYANFFLVSATPGADLDRIASEAVAAVPNSQTSSSDEFARAMNELVIVLVQSLTVGAIGSAIGLVASALAATLIKRGVPEFVTELRWTDAIGIFAAALVVSILAAYVPVRRINQIDPAMVFRA